MRADLLEMTGGDEDVLHEVIDLFLQDAPGRLAALQAALAARDGTAIYGASHSLKGSAGNFGGEPVMAAARAVEQFARAGQIDEAATAAAELERQVTALLAELRAL